MKKQILGTYTSQKSGNTNSVTIPANSGLKLEIQKNDTNFWDSLPKISEKEKTQEIKDLGYDPIEQHRVGQERLQD